MQKIARPAGNTSPWISRKGDRLRLLLRFSTARQSYLNNPYLCQSVIHEVKRRFIMIKVFATEQVRVLDRYTIQNKPISGEELVEEAAMAFVHEFMQHYSKIRRVVVFAGAGNNGADALAIARLLSDASYRVVTYLFNTKQHLTPECEEHKRRLLNIEQAEFFEIVSEFSLPELGELDVVIDGLFGSGLNHPLEGGFASLVKFINESPSETVAVDIPSGLFGENNLKNNPEAIIKAKRTFTFNFPKLAFLFPENEQFVGEWTLLNIDIMPEIVESTPAEYRVVTEEDMHMVFTPRPRFSHKGTYGHALLVAGSRGKMGAAILSAKACLRSGAGLLTVHTPKCGEEIIQIASPEAMADADEHPDFLTEVKSLASYTAIGIGPGIGQQRETAAALGDILNHTTRPLVIDADALNIISANPELLAKVPQRSILTPHPREFDRLAGESHSAYERLMKAKDFARAHCLVVILKDAYTAVCTPDGNVYFNIRGNAGMATAGSGDVLTGIVLGLLAQGFEPETAAVSAVFMHATAGDLAAKACSEESLIAGDIIEMLGKAFKTVK